MNDKFFGSFVFVKDGQFMIVEIVFIVDVLDFFDEWLFEFQDIFYQMMKWVCYVVYDGCYLFDVVCDVFVQWVRVVNILEDIVLILVWMIGLKFGFGGVLV